MVHDVHTDSNWHRSASIPSELLIVSYDHDSPRTMYSNPGMFQLIVTDIVLNFVSQCCSQFRFRRMYETEDTALDDESR